MLNKIKKILDKNKEKERQERTKMFIDEYRILSQKHKIDIFAKIQVAQDPEGNIQGILPQLGFKFLEDKPEQKL